MGRGKLDVVGRFGSGAGTTRLLLGIVLDKTASEKRADGYVEKDSDMEQLIEGKAAFAGFKPAVISCADAKPACSFLLRYAGGLSGGTDVPSNDGIGYVHSASFDWIDISYLNL